MNNLFDAYYSGNNPSDILQRQKQIDGLKSKMIQDAARKYINPEKFIRAVLKPVKKELKSF